MRKIKILSIIITVTIIFSTYVKALSEKIENEETNSITNTINENEPIEEPPTEENQTNVEPENNDYEPSYPSYNPPQYQEKKSENADLRVLKIENMEPEFSKDVTEYYLTVDLEIDKIDIEAYSDSEKASVDIQGNNDLQEGENKYFDFSVEVKLDQADFVEYEIAIEKDKAFSNIPDNEVKFYLEEENSGSFSKIFGPSEFKPLEKESDLGTEAGDMVLYSVKKNSSGTTNYRLRMWMADASTMPVGNYSVEVLINGKAN